MQNETTPRLRPWLVGAALLALSLMPRSAYAAEPIHTMLDGRELAFPTAVVVENDRTLVPARTLLEALGATVTWDDPTDTVGATLGNTVVKTVIGKTTAEVNGKPVELEVPPRIVDGHTLIPLRFFVEQLGLAISWENETRTIYIDTTRTVVSRDGSTVNRRGATVAAEALKLVGTPYAWGGTSPSTGFDCSGFVYYLGKTYGGVELPRTSYEMFSAGVKVAKADLQAGDLVFFETYAPGASHVGVYDGKGGFIHSQNAETGVKVTPLSYPWWVERYLGARLVFR